MDILGHIIFMLGFYWSSFGFSEETDNGLFINNKYHLQRLCRPFKLQINGETVNRKYSPAEKVAKEKEWKQYLFGFSLEDRITVWCEMINVMNITGSRRRGHRRNVVDVVAEGLIVMEGDIILTADDLKSRRNRERCGEIPPQGRRLRVKRKFTSKAGRTWTLPIDYLLGKSIVGAANIAVFRAAVAEWERETCIRFNEVTFAKTPSYMKFELDPLYESCGSAVVGKRQDQKPNEIKITGNRKLGCPIHGTILHEMGHALGFWHEHQRSDRNQFVKVKCGAHGFGSERTNNFGIPYDYFSIMHYNRYIKTIDRKYQHVIGQLGGLSFHDSKLANFVYCSDKCGGNSLESPRCHHGGYLDPNNCGRCRCQVGFTGTGCSKNDNMPVCGEDVLVVEDQLRVRQKKYVLQSPGHPKSSSEAMVKCAWTIRLSSSVPKTVTIKAWFEGRFNIKESASCVEDFVEIRYQIDKSITGPRYCGSSLPRVKFRSEGTEMMVIYHAKPGDENYGGFKLKYQIVDRLRKNREIHWPKFTL